MSIATTLLGLALGSLPAWPWKGALLLAVAGAASLLLHHRSPALRHLLWSGALVGVLVLPLAERLPAAWKLPLPQPTVKAPARLDAPLPADAGLPAATVSAAGRRGVDVRATGAPQHDASPPTFPLPLAAPSWLLATIWAGGALLGLARLGVAQRRRLRLRDGAQVLPAEWQRLAAECAARLNLRRPVRLLGSDETEMPMTWGILHPVVLLPASAARWSPALRGDVLLHELAHVKRGDAVGLELSHLACVVHWFDPLAWLAARRLREEAEHACDDLVLLAGSRPPLYAGHLLAVARALRAALPSTALTLPMARQRRLASRIAAILDEARDRRPPGRVAAAATLFACAMVVLPLAAAGTRPAEPKLVDRPAEPRAHVSAHTPGATIIAPAGASHGPQLVPVDEALDSVRAQMSATIAPTIATAISPPAIASVEPAVAAIPAATAGSVLDARVSRVTNDQLAPLAPLAPRAVSISSALPGLPTPPAPQALVAVRLPADNFTFFGIACRDQGERPSTHIHRDGSGLRVRFQKGRCRLDIDLKGELRLADDGRGITYLAPGSHLHITELSQMNDVTNDSSVDLGDGFDRGAPGIRRKGTVRELIVEPSRTGEPRLFWWVDGLPGPIDSRVLIWLARLVSELSLQTGADPAQRDR